MQGPSVASTRLSGWRGPESAPTGPVPSLTVARASPPLGLLALAAGTAGSTRAARNATPLRSFMAQGWATSPCTLTGWPWRMPEGRPGTLTARISASPSARAMSWMTYSGSPFSSARGRLVSKSRTGCGSRAHRNAMADVSTGSFMATSFVSWAPSGRCYHLHIYTYRWWLSDGSTRVLLSQGTVKLEQADGNACGLAKRRRPGGDQGDCESEGTADQPEVFSLQRAIVHNQRQAVTGQRA
jgi:hypothetical protein